MVVLRFASAIVLALAAGFLLVGPAVVAGVAIIDSHASMRFHGSWPLVFLGVVAGAGLLAVSARLLAPRAR